MEGNLSGMSGKSEDEEVSENVGKKYRAAGGKIVTKRRTFDPQTQHEIKTGNGSNKAMDGWLQVASLAIILRRKHHRNRCYLMLR
ncbi:hypothetical protein RvY_10763 [Ramazzottius varieornatus]|uniref:Uncharacterized protein n=1 Tax=Ramazzottius varieornatus TaxID=947166 RepID=A0A1D1VDU7_RAMVA|nr:hypothetical protein RvY_10763 [Ramazzottius varieornatus]